MTFIYAAPPPPAPTPRRRRAAALPPTVAAPPAPPVHAPTVLVDASSAWAAYERRRGRSRKRPQTPATSSYQVLADWLRAFLRHHTLDPSARVAVVVPPPPAPAGAARRGAANGSANGRAVREVDDVAERVRVDEEFSTLATRAVRDTLGDHADVVCVQARTRFAELASAAVSKLDSAASLCVFSDDAVGAAALDGLEVRPLGFDEQDDLELLVKNVRGVGVVRGTKLLKLYGSLRGVLAAARAGEVRPMSVREGILQRADLLCRPTKLPLPVRNLTELRKLVDLIPGIGPVRAESLLREHGSLRGILDAASAGRIDSKKLPSVVVSLSSSLTGVPAPEEVSKLQQILSTRSAAQVLGNARPPRAPPPDPDAPECLIIDALGLIYRHFYAAPAQLRSGAFDMPTNAIYGFTVTLLGLLESHAGKGPVVVVFDGCHTGDMDARRRAFPDYKANRTPMPDKLQVQIPLIKQLVSAFGLPMLEVPSTEADDVIGTLALRAAEQGLRSTILSSDKDFSQILQQGVIRIRRPAGRGKWETITEDDFKNQFVGLTPEQFVDFLALVGDKADNIPGVKGIGPVTARSLLKEHKSVTELLRLLDTDELSRKHSKMLLAGKEDLLLSQKLVSLMLDIDLGDVDVLEDLMPDVIYRRALQELFEKLEFSGLMKRLATYLDNCGTRVVDDEPRTEAKPQPVTRVPWDPPTDSEIEVTQISTLEDLQLALKETEPGSSVGFSAYGNGNVVLCLEDRRVVDCPRSVATAALVRSPVRIAGWDLKDMGRDWLPETTAALFDVKLAQSLLEPDATPQLHMVIAQYLSLELDFDPMEPETLEQSVKVARIVRQLAERLEGALRSHELYSIAADVEFPLISVLSRIERHGLPLVAKDMEGVMAQVDKELRAVDERAKAILGDENAVNLASVPQVSATLYDRMGVKPKKGSRNTKLGRLSTAGSVLVEIRDDKESNQQVRDFCDTVLSFRELSRTRSSIKSYQTLQREGRIFATFNQLGAATGRLSVSKPNLQAVPSRSPTGSQLRKAVRAPNGSQLVCADYEQVELRIIAALSEDKALCAAFAEGQDVHSSVAARIFGVPESEVTREQRKTAKEVNYGIPYGISAFGLSSRLQISVRESKQLIADYYSAFPRVKGLTEKLVASAKELGFAQTLGGRRRYLPLLASKSRTERMASERMAVNTPIQGTQADMIKLAMVRLSEALEQEKLEARIVLQVHDELLLEVPDQEVDEVTSLVRETMSTAMRLPHDVKVLVDVKVAKTWLEANPH